MHLQARVYIRTALAYLALSFAVWALILIDRGFAIDSRIRLLLPVFYHLLTVGWITQLIAGVALWMFPPLSRERPRGNERAGWCAYGALNVGLVLRAIFEPLQTLQATWGWALALSALLQVAAAWALVLLIWPRVKARPDRRNAS